RRVMQTSDTRPANGAEIWQIRVTILVSPSSFRHLADKRMLSMRGLIRMGAIMAGIIPPV
ncbi:hypothetical protein, partial [Roseicyclus sp.]|uniref:hypothetical protein n=1 Tax=Roseicyclus sp. TaxID=1914329 RepID=UPI0040547403